MNCTLLKGGLVVDGTGETPFFADVLIRDRKIDAVVPLGESLPTHTADHGDIEIIDASGCIVTSGICRPPHPL